MLQMFLVGVLLLARASGGAVFHVDPSAPASSDDNPGTVEKPWKTLAHSARSVQPGDTVLIATGIYREQLSVTRSGTREKPIRFEAEPGARVVMTGADRISGWQKEGTAFSVAWPHSFIDHSPNHTHPDDEAHRLVGRAEQVFVQNYALRQVLDRAKLTRGTFYVDLENKRLHAEGFSGEDFTNANVLVEASVRGTVLLVEADDIVIRGIHVLRAANPAQHGAALIRGRRITLEDCSFMETNGVGASFLNDDITARRCAFLDNGQLGFGALRAHRLLITDSTIRNNNTKGYNRGWEAGGNKIVLSRGVVLEKSIFEKNRGNAVWFDIGNEDATVRNCLIADNEDAGIFYEISYGLHAHDNVILGNGFADTPGAWGAAAAISLSSSPGCTIERNLMIGNREGFNFREQSRTTSRIDGKPEKEEPVWNHDQVIRNNILAWNRDAQVRGWFDVDDERHWPATMQTTKPPRDSTLPADLAAMKLAFSENLYATRGQQKLFVWGTSWRRSKEFATLDDVRTALSLEQNSVLHPLMFANFAARDLRVPPDSPAVRMKSYPTGGATGARLGIAD